MTDTYSNGLEHAENGDVGLNREPHTMPSHDARNATISVGEYKLIVGYRWAIYGYISPDGKLTVFRGWKNYSTDTGSAITALEAAAAKSVPGAPAIELPPRNASDQDIAFTDEIIHVRTKNSAVPDHFPTDHLVFQVPHPADE